MTSIFNQHPQVIMRGQIFKDDPAYRAQLEAIGTAPFTGQLFDDAIDTRKRFDRLEEQPGQREARNAAEVVETFYHSQEVHTYDRKAVGIKLHGGTLFTDELEAAFFGKQPYTFMVLHRENLLAASISWYQARANNAWVARTAEEVKRAPTEMDIDQLIWFAEENRRDVQLWKDLLAKYGKDYLELTYEQVTAPNYSYDDIWDYLGVDNFPTPPPKTKKLIKKYDHIANLEDIRAAFKELNFGMV